MPDVKTDYSGIIIRLRNANESVMFPSLVNQALRKIASKPTGYKLLSGIASLSGKAKFGFTVCIRRPKNMSIANGVWCGTNIAIRAKEEEAMKENVGSVTVIDFNANIITTPDGTRPAFIGLAHELIHAYYNLRGQAIRGKSEELATVGLGKGKQREITENAIRAEHKIPLREAYSGL